MNKLKVYIGLCVMLYINNVQAQKNIYVSTSGYKEIGTPVLLNTIDGGVTFNIGNYIAAGAGVNVCKFWDDNYSSVGAGLGPVLQIYAIKKSKYKLFLEGKGDVMYMFPEYPSTAINFTGYFGAFTEHMVNAKNGVRLGLCYTHFSNGKGVGYAANPCLDGLGFNIGWVFH